MISVQGGHLTTEEYSFFSVKIIDRFTLQLSTRHSLVLFIRGGFLNFLTIPPETRNYPRHSVGNCKNIPLWPCLLAVYNFISSFLFSSPPPAPSRWSGSACTAPTSGSRLASACRAGSSRGYRYQPGTPPGDAICSYYDDNKSNHLA